jgi:hypothetical protein
MQQGEVSGFNGKITENLGITHEKCLSMRGFTTVCIIIQPKSASLLQGENLRIFSLKSQMDEKMARRSRRQPILYKTAVKVDNKFKYASRKHRNNCVSLIVID